MVRGARRRVVPGAAPAFRRGTGASSTKLMQACNTRALDHGGRKRPVPKRVPLRPWRRLNSLVAPAQRRITGWSRHRPASEQQDRQHPLGRQAWHRQPRHAGCGGTHLPVQRSRSRSSANLGCRCGRRISGARAVRPATHAAGPSSLRAAPGRSGESAAHRPGKRRWTRHRHAHRNSACRSSAGARAAAIGHSGVVGDRCSAACGVRQPRGATRGSANIAQIRPRRRARAVVSTTCGWRYRLRCRKRLSFGADWRCIGALKQHQRRQRAHCVHVPGRAAASAASGVTRGDQVVDLAAEHAPQASSNSSRGPASCGNSRSASSRHQPANGSTPPSCAIVSRPERTPSSMSCAL